MFKGKDQYLMGAQLIVHKAIDGMRGIRPIRMPAQYPGCLINSEFTHRQTLDCFALGWPYHKCSKCYWMWDCRKVYELIRENGGERRVSKRKKRP